MVQGLCYYDSFVIGAKCEGIGVAGSAAAILDAPVLTLNGGKATVTPVEDVTFYATVDGSDPRSSTSRLEVTGDGVSVPAGATIRCAGEKDGCASMEVKQTNS